jgi:hypothetical protein
MFHEIITSKKSLCATTTRKTMLCLEENIAPLQWMLITSHRQVTLLSPVKIRKSTT